MGAGGKTQFTVVGDRALPNLQKLSHRLRAAQGVDDGSSRREAGRQIILWFLFHAPLLGRKSSYVNKNEIKYDIIYKK